MGRCLLPGEGLLRVDALVLLLCLLLLRLLLLAEERGVLVRAGRGTVGEAGLGVASRGSGRGCLPLGHHSPSQMLHGKASSVLWRNVRVLGPKRSLELAHGCDKVLLLLGLLRSRAWRTGTHSCQVHSIRAGRCCVHVHSVVLHESLCVAAHETCSIQVPDAVDAVAHGRR